MTLPYRRLITLAVLPTIVGIALGASLSAGFDQKKIKPEARKPKREISNVPTAGNWGIASSQTFDAWRLTQGSHDIVVAVIDTGIDVHHPDLKANLWMNEGETGLDDQGRSKSSNGIDDDQNGFIDDVHGWNFVDEDSKLTDNHGHGTHIAGIIGATGHSAIMGIAPNVKIMTLKYYDPYVGEQNPLANTIKSIHYAIQMGADIINYSGGGLSPNSSELAALKEAHRHGILVVAAAGNEKSNSDIQPYYPADYELDNIMSVTAINRTKRILPSSNWGARTVDIAAPGDKILSTLPGNAYGEMTGTSQATAFVTGVAVLLMAARPDLASPIEIIEHIMNTGEAKSDFVGKVKSRSALNSYRSIAMIGKGVSAAGTISEDVSDAEFTIGLDQ